MFRFFFLPRSIAPSCTRLPREERRGERCGFLSIMMSTTAKHSITPVINPAAYEAHEDLTLDLAWDAAGSQLSRARLLVVRLRSLVAVK
jgi:hypothetical protein